MNERIHNLALKAANGMLSYDAEGDFRLSAVEVEKFAELIVRECVEQMELVRKYRYDRVQPLENQQTIIDECQYQIKQHFGLGVEDTEEDSACPLCGEDGGTTCGIPDCQY